MLPKDYVRLRLCGEHAIDVADASGTLLLDVARRRWSDEVLEALELDPAWLPRLLESPEVSGETPDGVPGRRRRGRPGRRRARRRRRPSGAALDRARHERRRVRGAARVRRRRARPRARVLPRGARRLARDGRDALRRRLAAVAARRRRARRRRSATLVGGGRALGARRRGADVPALPRGRAHAARRPRRARLVHRPLAAPRPRRAHPRGARGRRVRAARLARPAARARRRARARPRLRRRRALGAVAAHHRVRARASRWSGPWWRRAPRTAPRCSAASRAACGRTPRPRSPRRCEVRGEVEPDPAWVAAYAEGRERFRALYPALRAVG